MVKRRIVYINGWGYGNFQIQKQKSFLGLIKYWSGTHLCPSLQDAESLVEYLNTKTHEYGTVLRTYN